MNRREFVAFLASIGAGLAAQPTQVASFEKYYEANTPWFSGNTGLIAIDEIYIGGMASKSTRLNYQLYRTGECVLNLAVNAFGGIIRWVAMPDAKIVTIDRDFTWSVLSPDMTDNEPSPVQGHILYVDQEGLRHTHLLSGGRRGNLALRES